MAYRPRWYYPLLNVAAILLFVPLLMLRDALRRFAGPK